MKWKQDNGTVVAELACLQIRFLEQMWLANPVNELADAGLRAMMMMIYGWNVELAAACQTQEPNSPTGAVHKVALWK